MNMKYVFINNKDNYDFLRKLFILKERIIKLPSIEYIEEYDKRMCSILENRINKFILMYYNMIDNKEKKLIYLKGRCL